MTTPAKYLIVVGGPTASGKTTLAIQLAQHFGAPILSADSRQFYKEMRIGTARPSSEELQQVPHLFVADRSVKKPLSAGAFAREALAYLEVHYQQHNYAIVVGGSGLFLRALTEGLDHFPTIPEDIRVEVAELYRSTGLTGLQEAVRTADPDYFALVDRQNPARLMRALEVCRSGEHTYTYYRQQKVPDRFFVPIYLQPNWPRELLYERINHRVDLMVEAGLEEEARELQPLCDLPALQTVGYQEWFSYFLGKHDRETAVELTRRNSRRYAKRQLTWLRRDGYWKHCYQGDLRTALAYIKLVEEEHLTVRQLKEDAASELLEVKWERAGFDHLLIALYDLKQAEMVGWARGYINREQAVLIQWEWTAVSHLGKANLLHEWVHASRCEQVFALLSEEDGLFFTSQGWDALLESDHGLSKKLAPLLPKHGRLFRWQLSQAAF